MLLTNVEHPYLCTVFFIVLDFKVNKGWSTAVLLFLCLYVSSYINRIFLVDTF